MFHGCNHYQQQGGQRNWCSRRNNLGTASKWSQQALHRLQWSCYIQNPCFTMFAFPFFVFCKFLRNVFVLVPTLFLATSLFYHACLHLGQIEAFEKSSSSKHSPVSLRRTCLYCPTTKVIPCRQVYKQNHNSAMKTLKLWNTITINNPAFPLCPEGTPLFKMEQKKKHPLCFISSEITGMFYSSIKNVDFF